MAEHVQAALDDMVAPLRDWLDRGIFSQTEIQAIVARRRESEYALRRRAARKADFLRYIESEMALESLRQLRTKKVSNRRDRKTDETAARKKNGGLPIGDVHVVQLIHLLFIRALRKFRSDVALHLQHAAFARESKSYNKLTTIYTEALQVHPRNVGLWIEAASHEFFGHREGNKIHGGGAIQSARVLMQRGLRINSKSQDLWIQYFCLELHYLQKLRGRREILQLTNKDEEEEDALYRDAPIAVVVYKNAIKAIPDSVSFRMKFLDQCQLFPQTDVLERIITESMETDFANKPESWIARAAYVAGKQGQATEPVLGFARDADHDDDESDDEPVSKKLRINDPCDTVLTILEQALDAIPTADMYLMMIQFCREYTNESNEAATTAFVESLFNRATSEKKVMTSELALEHSDYLASQGKLEAAIQSLKDFSHSQNSIDVTLQVAMLLQRNDEVAEAVDELERCVARTPIHEPKRMTVLLELFGAMLESGTARGELKEVFETILLLSPNNNPTFEPYFGIGSVAHACLRFLQECKSQNVEARAVVDAVVERSTYSESAEGKTEIELQAMASFFDEALDAMKPSAKTMKREQKLVLRRLYDKAIRFFEHCAPEIADSYRSRKDDFQYS
ncbi:U3 small nucleolar RNA-associated protein 6 [Fragilaria crotonensis]|nr:U3 small nucleolar RNA-associated protein 6 [Fragilaria crotonensis]